MNIQGFAQGPNNKIKLKCNTLDCSIKFEHIIVLNLIVLKNNNICVYFILINNLIEKLSFSQFTNMKNIHKHDEHKPRKLIQIKSSKTMREREREREQWHG